MADEDKTNALLARLDERTVAIQNEVSSFRSDLRSMNESYSGRLKDIQDDLEKNYVTKDQFGPIQKLVYGFVAVVTMAVLGAMLSAVINK